MRRKNGTKLNLERLLSGSFSSTVSDTKAYLKLCPIFQKNGVCVRLVSLVARVFFEKQ